MQRRLITYKRLLATCLLWACMLTSAMAQEFATRPALWTSQPTLSSDAQLDYQFRSTSSFNTTMHTKVYRPMAGLPTATGTIAGGERRGYFNGDGEWVEDDDNPIGVLPDPAPVGEPLVLLALAMLYLLYRRRKKAEC